MSEDYEAEVNEYTDILFNTVEGAPGRAYLARRGITPDTAKHWRLGFSPANFKPVCYEGKAIKFSFWERMNNRVTIPVLDVSGRVVAISGRAVVDEVTPKYWHYQFPTRRTLFGLYQNRQTVFNENLLIFTEGQLDVISAWQRGFRVVASTFGAHFSSDQLALAARFTDRVAILFDADRAGQDGALASLTKAEIRGDVDVKILRGFLKPGEDLDGWVAQNDYRAIIDHVNRRDDLNSLEARLRRLNAGRDDS